MNSEIEVKTLYSKTCKLEKEIQISKGVILDKKILQKRQNLRDLYYQMLELDIIYSISKEIDHLLWKTCFYKVIEEYRQGIKQGGNEIQSSFLQFLKESIQFYLKFNFTNLEYKNLMNLGDLERYYALYSNKDYTKACFYYEKGLNHSPNYGNAHNQIAVISTYQNNDFEAIYRYFRSLSCEFPFQSAKENLKIFFEKKKYNSKVIKMIGVFYLKNEIEWIEWKDIKFDSQDEIYLIKLIIIIIYLLEIYRNEKLSIEKLKDFSLFILSSFEQYLSIKIILLKYFKLYSIPFQKDSFKKNFKFTSNCPKILLPEEKELNGFIVPLFQMDSLLKSNPSKDEIEQKRSFIYQKLLEPLQIIQDEEDDEDEIIESTFPTFTTDYHVIDNPFSKTTSNIWSPLN